MNARLKTASDSRHAIRPGPGGAAHHIPSLDGIRALAALWVFAAHAGLQRVAPASFGVTIFFFLSGYLITTLLRLEHESTGGISLKRFYLRRVYRIFPPMYIVLGLAALLSLIGITPGDMTLGAVAAQAGHLTNYYGILHGVSHIIPNTGIMWSLAIEEHFYLLYPLALVLLLKRCDFRQIAAVLACTCVAILLWRCYLVLGLNVTNNYLFVATDARMDSLLYGCILGVWSNPSFDAPVLRAGRWVWAITLGAAVGLLVVTFQANRTFRYTVGYSLQGIALFPIFYCAIRFHEWPLFRWLNFRWVRGFGLISYTFYLTHISALRIVRQFSPYHPRRSVLVAFVVAVAFSTCMYFFVERYFAALRRRLHR